MKFKSMTIATVLLALLAPSILYAQQKVVVIPLLGNESELKPLSPEDLIDVRRAFTFNTDDVLISTVTNDHMFVLKSILIAPEQYPAVRRPISLRFCRTPNGTNCSHAWKVPNDTITRLDFGIGEIFDIIGSHYIDVSDRGGLPQNSANQISVHVSGYRIQR